MSSQQSISVLLVEDNPADARLLREGLSEAGTPCNLRHVRSLDDMWEQMRSGRYDVILLDLGLPESQGLETLRRVYALYSETPIVVMTGLDDEETAVEAVQAGAQDYLVKGQAEPRVLLRTLRHAIERHRMLTELELARRREHYMATHDGLTGLPNRQLFFDLLTQSMAYASRYGQWLAVLFVDLDKFKDVNDTLGHETGDRLLQGVAERLQHCIRSSDTAARLGGDEFILVLVNVTRAQDASTVAGNLLQEIGRSYVIADHEVSVLPSIGISIFPGDGTSAEMLVRNADAAMYSAKRHGGSTYQFYAPSMRPARFDRGLLETGLRTAVQDNDLCLYFQPQIDASTGAVVAAEALLRWNHPELGVIGPAVFLPVAEEAGLIHDIGSWCLRAACDQLRSWADQGYPPIRMTVNLSSRQLRHPELPSAVENALRAARLEPPSLELEIPETAVLGSGSAEVSAETFRALRALGVRIALDGFGQGPASAVALQRCPSDAVKIDASLIRGLGHDGREAPVAAVLALAESQGVDSVASGVEKRDQLDWLQARRCRKLQGYYFCQPVPARDFGQILEEGNLLRAVPRTL